MLFSCLEGIIWNLDCLKDDMSGVIVAGELKRKFCCVCLVFFLLPICFWSGLQAKAEGAPEPQYLNVAGWDVYADPERNNKLIGYESFEKRFGVQVKFTPLANLDAIISAAESGDPVDVFIISNEGVKVLHDMGLVRPLELENLPHYENLHPSLIYNKWCQFNGHVFAVPWAWGPTGLLYDTEQISKPDSWNILWDPKYRNQVALWDDLSMIWIAALSLGYQNVYNLTRPQLEQVKNRLLQLNRQVYGYYSGEAEEMDFIKNRNVVILNSWFDPSHSLGREDRKFKMVIPREGAVGMFDSYLISANSENAELAHAFINHQISLDTQLRMVRITGLAPANIETLTLMSSDEIKAFHLDEPDYFNRMLLWDVMPRRNLYENLLQEIREDFMELRMHGNR